MTGRSHLVLGVACVLTAMSAAWIAPSLEGLCAGALGSLVPDIDTERSMLGSRLKPVSRLLARWCGHRTVTHSLFVPFALAVLIATELGQKALAGPLGAFLIGYASHILGDLPTGGCWALYPLSRNRIAFWPYAKVGSFREYLVLLGSLALLCVLSYHNLSAQPGETAHRAKSVRFIAQERLRAYEQADHQLPRSET